MSVDAERREHVRDNGDAEWANKGGGETCIGYNARVMVPSIDWFRSYRKEVV